MKNVLKIASQFFALSIIVFCATVIAAGQSREARLISAHAGGVNFVSGDVSFKRADGGGEQRLSLTDDLKSGDRVKTGARAQVEVLLNPGSYLRLGENSEFELTDNSLENLRLKFVRGNAVIEAVGYDDLGPLMVIDTPQASVSVIRSGVYRLNVLQPGSVTEVGVRKGRMFVNAKPSVLVKEGNLARITSGGVEIARFDKKMRDALDEWSKERGAELAKVNEKLSTRNVNTLLANYNYNSFASMQSVNAFAGLWIFDPRRGCYTFLPFTSDWRSPYGYWYEHRLLGFYDPFDSGCSGCNRRRLGIGVAGNNSRTNPNDPTDTAPGTTRPIRQRDPQSNPNPIIRDFPRERPTPIERAPLERMPGAGAEQRHGKSRAEPVPRDR